MSAETCAWCPWLCRHACPVAVATGREAATPTAMRTWELLAKAGQATRADALAGTSLCNGCGACTAYCAVDAPVAEALRAWRAETPPRAGPLAPILGDAPVVCVIAVGRPDWSEGWARSSGIAVARLQTADSLGAASWRAGDPGVTAALAAHLAGRARVVVDEGEAEEVLRAAGVPVERVAPPVGDGALRFVTCFEGPLSSAAHQLACCGRREGFPAREPEAAGAVARENARRLDGAAAVCADGACAAWLRAHGANVQGPGDNG
jgi:hypothetical protein